MRMTPEELERTTGRLLPATQARWFKQHFGVEVAYDRQGPIITKATFEALVAKKCGLTKDTVVSGERPTVKIERRA